MKKSIVLVSEPFNGKSVYEIYLRTVQKCRLDHQEMYFNEDIFRNKKFNLKLHLEQYKDPFTLIVISDVKKNFDYLKLYDLISSGYTTSFGDIYYPQIIIKTEHLPKRNASFDALFDVFKIEKK